MTVKHSDFEHKSLPLLCNEVRCYLVSNCVYSPPPHFSCAVFLRRRLWSSLFLFSLSPYQFADEVNSHFQIMGPLSLNFWRVGYIICWHIFILKCSFILKRKVVGLKMVRHTTLMLLSLSNIGYLKYDFRDYVIIRWYVCLPYLLNFVFWFGFPPKVYIMRE